MTICFYRVFIFFIGFMFSIVLILTNSTFCFAGDVKGVTKNTIKIGSIADQTGPVATVLQMVAKGHRNYFTHINNQGGINGRKIKYILEDDHYQIPKTLACFKKLMFKDEVFAFMGGGSTAAILLLKKKVKKLKTPYLSTATGEAVVIPPEKYMFNLGVAYEDEIKVIFNYLINIIKVKNLRLGLVRPDTEHGKVGVRETENQAKLYGINLMADEVLSVGALEASSQVLGLKRRKINYVILHHVTAAGSAFLRGCRKYRYLPKIIGTKWTCTDDIIRLSGKSIENYIGDAPYSSWYDDNPGCNEMRKITLKLYPGTEKPYRAKTYTMGWTDAYIVTEALRRSGKNLTKDGLIKAMESIKNFSTNGLSGPITYGPNDRKATDYCRMYKPDIKRGILVPITDWIRPVK
ncbi:MAG: ABC transporter substrate-binding protein [Spirochaetota bacterium]|nr:ABC transporter substrate-binding protein [Spirochaetota bacterium]